MIMSPLPCSAGVDSDRRFFLRQAGAAAVWPWLSARLEAADDQPAGPGPDQSVLIARDKEPLCLEFPFATLKDFQMPNPQFFVRNHFTIPQLEVQNWRLRVEGAVQRPFELTYDELRKLPAHTQTTLIECTGNGRAFLTPRAKGVQWELGGVSNAQWTGVALADLLRRAGARPDAAEIILEGADFGEPSSEPRPAGKIHFARSLPFSKARQPNVLLAYLMNGERLAPAHGYPLRAIVPGWYGVAMVKWLTRIIVAERPFRGYSQTFDYSYFRRGPDQLPIVVAVGELQVKAQIARPARGEMLPAGKEVRIFGAAWTGESEVTRVDISTDGGKTWQPANLLDKPIPYTWRFWEMAWRPDQPGRYRLLARAADRRGHVQPLERNPDLRNYLISHPVPVEVEVRG
jgi:DMSO/TMAO reductase YedYZ molybdopterin-dependent catalytic subunit